MKGDHALEWFVLVTVLTVFCLVVGSGLHTTYKGNETMQGLSAMFVCLGGAGIALLLLWVYTALFEDALGYNELNFVLYERGKPCNRDVMSFRVPGHYSGWQSISGCIRLGETPEVMTLEEARKALREVNTVRYGDFEPCRIGRWSKLKSQCEAALLKEAARAHRKQKLRDEDEERNGTPM